MRRSWAITKRTVVAFYDDQMTQHAAAITYYSLMSLFPAILLALSILGLVGEYPRTYDAIVRYLNDVAPPSVVRPIDESLRDAFRNKSTATTGLFLSIFLAFFGTTGVLESIRRALNVVFVVENGRSFLRRKAVDVLSTFALLALVLSTLVFVVVGKGLAEDILRLVGADENAAQIWGLLRWPAAVASALLGFSFVYYVTPDLRHRAYHLVTPGAALGVAAWLLVSYGLSEYISNVVNIGALYGAFTGAIVVVLWLWFSSCSLLLGAELNAAITRQRAIDSDEGALLVAPPAEAEDSVGGGILRSARRRRREERERLQLAAEEAEDEALRAADASGHGSEGDQGAAGPRMPVEEPLAPEPGADAPLAPDDHGRTTDPTPSDDPDGEPTVVRGSVDRPAGDRPAGADDPAQEPTAVHKPGRRREP
ncbi:YihY/virulence factor BrkB family protein [Patulibacter sp. NPDC049589]|uniref:YihY/virulence factor BrkB family protein n=1 Tax=Patulibacter sp. NPDC049589 TaxID=3154731 RepID=UPI00343D5F5E